MDAVTIVLFAKDLAYRVNLKNQILKQRPPLNLWCAGALRCD